TKIDRRSAGCVNGFHCHEDAFAGLTLPVSHELVIVGTGYGIASSASSLAELADEGDLIHQRLLLGGDGLLQLQFHSRQPLGALDADGRDLMGNLTARITLRDLNDRVMHN